ncbi:nitrogen fixation protein NifU [Proteiniborus ethanoligenes]|uniref:Nitrogen fixation protein NifU n=2 Tax=Proteiniborus ethanoligenes TaxID=415015 RepID=A0A1H3KVJ0_9FIRM|nr:nitrogen fixation protein NifU [Proteiniborus ethanoligenes]
MQDMEHNQYSQETIDHFMNPRNVGKIENPDGVGIAGDPECGDYIEITISVKDYFIKDIKFMVHGCVGAISTSSMTTELAKGKPLMAAYAISNEDVINALGGLPSEKEHCSLLGPIALKKAIVDYINKNKSILEK